jgi:hypothetical protein
MQRRKWDAKTKTLIILEGLWQQLKGVELRNVCCFNIPHLRHELCDAVKRVRRKPQILQGFSEVQASRSSGPNRRTMLLGCARWA